MSLTPGFIPSVNHEEIQIIRLRIIVKDQSWRLFIDATLHCITRSTGTWERESFTTQGKRVVELLLQLENKQQIMQNNVETQHKHMISIFIDSLCNIAFPIVCFTCIVTSQVFVALSSAFYRDRKH